MTHLGFAWIWLMWGLLVGTVRLGPPSVFGWSALLLPLAALLFLRSRWRMLFVPRPGVNAVCWLGHAFMGAAAACFLALSTPLGSANVIGFGLLIGLLLTPLPVIGAVAWLVQIVQLVLQVKQADRQLRP